VPQQPFSPNRRQINILGLLMGLALGVALAAVLEYRDSTLKTEDDVRLFLSLPVLAAIPVLAERVAPRHKTMALGASRLARWVLRGGPSES